VCRNVNFNFEQTCFIFTRRFFTYDECIRNDSNSSWTENPYYVLHIYRSSTHWETVFLHLYYSHDRIKVTIFYIRELNIICRFRKWNIHVRLTRTGYNFENRLDKILTILPWGIKKLSTYSSYKILPVRDKTKNHRARVCRRFKKRLRITSENSDYG